MTSKKRKEVRISEIIIPKYHSIFNDRSIKHIILTSGRAGTKSSFAGIRTDYQIMSEKAAAVILRKHHNKLRKTVYKEMLRAIKRLGIENPKKYFDITKSPMEIRYKKTGSTIYFSGSDSVDDTKGIIDEDTPIKLVVLDELTEFFDDGEGEDEIANIEATFVRGNAAGFQMIYLYNPPKNPNAQINEWCRKMEQREDCIHIHADYRDVPREWLGEDLINSAEIMEKIDQKRYRWIWLGESVGVDELIYYMFSEGCKEKPEKDRVYQRVIVGGDYGQQNATTFQYFGMDDHNRKMQGLAEYYHSGRETGKQRSPSQYAEDFLEECREIHARYNTPVFYLYLDPSASGLQEEIKRKMRLQAEENNFVVYVKDAENKVELGISRVQKALTYGIMKINPKQKMAVKEFGLYEYDQKSIEKGKEIPVKENDHCMDAIRYAVMGAWKTVKWWMPETEKEEES